MLGCLLIVGSTREGVKGAGVAGPEPAGFGPALVANSGPTASSAEKRHWNAMRSMQRGQLYLRAGRLE